jgi:transposase
MRHELPPDQRACPACGGELTEMAGQTEETDRITAVKLTYQVEHQSARSTAVRVTAPWSPRQAPHR